MINNQEDMKKVFIEHKHGIEIFQHAVINSIASIVYCEFIQNIQLKEYPSPHYLIPRIDSVRSFLKTDGDFMSDVGKQLIAILPSNRWVQYVNYKEHPDFVLFRDDNIDMTDSILRSYILPNASRGIPEVISRKFEVGSDSRKGVIDESYELDIFSGGIPFSYYKYIIDETCMQLLKSTDSVDRKVVPCTDPSSIEIGPNSMLGINHRCAICQILLSTDMVIDNNIMRLIGRATETSLIDSHSNGNYIVSSGQTNCLEIYDFSK